MSRVWGYVNSLELPIWFRPYGFRLYAFAFGCNLDEIEPSDLREYPSLGAFFYRKLKDGARPVDPAILVRLLPSSSRRFLTQSPFTRSVLQTEQCYISVQSRDQE